MRVPHLGREGWDQARPARLKAHAQNHLFYSILEQELARALLTWPCWGEQA